MKVYVKGQAYKNWATNNRKIVQHGKTEKKNTMGVGCWLVDYLNVLFIYGHKAAVSVMLLYHFQRYSYLENYNNNYHPSIFKNHLYPVQDYRVTAHNKAKIFTPKF